jgi:para-aminobenzoate synthetase component 1
MDGYQASDAVESYDSLQPLSCTLDEEDFWAVVGSYEGQWQVIRFAKVEKRERLGLEDSRMEQANLTWRSALTAEEYRDYVEVIREEIRKGWVYQVNACRLIESSGSLNFIKLFHNIQSSNPAPAAAYFKSDRWEVASASPETFFKVDSNSGVRRITVSPIKGTSRDGKFQEKDSAENVMIVDLMRNDISPLCEVGSVEVPRLLGVEQHPGLFHLVSDVQGALKESITFADILNRLAPAGSITGAPKSSAREVISRFEPFRGIYCGTIGWIHGGRAHFSVAIRTFFRDLQGDANRNFFGTGAGITWGSDAQSEWDETELKADRLIKIASGVL